MYSKKDDGQHGDVIFLGYDFPHMFTAAKPNPNGSLFPERA
jgi:hypothetical protein